MQINFPWVVSLGETGLWGNMDFRVLNARVTVTTSDLSPVGLPGGFSGVVVFSGRAATG